MHKGWQRYSVVWLLSQKCAQVKTIVLIHTWMSFMNLLVCLLSNYLPLYLKYITWCMQWKFIRFLTFLEIIFYFVCMPLSCRTRKVKSSVGILLFNYYQECNIHVLMTNPSRWLIIKTINALFEVSIFLLLSKYKTKLT